jgi:hypothetical protein
MQGSCTIIIIPVKNLRRGRCDKCQRRANPSMLDKTDTFVCEIRVLINYFPDGTTTKIQLLVLIRQQLPFVSSIGGLQNSQENLLLLLLAIIYRKKTFQRTIFIKRIENYGAVSFSSMF